MTEAGPSTPSRPRTGKFAGQRGRNNNHFKYGAPLPILLPCSPLYPHAQQPDTSHDVAATSRLLAWMASALTLHSESPINPMCSGTFDPMTKSVWVTSQLDKHILFDRGFFGKGNLSRSDPSWWKRRVKVLQGGNTITSEEVTAMRRRERKQFKVDRAQAFLNASLAAEAILKAKSSNSADVPSAAMEEPNHDLARTSSRTSLASPAPVVTAADKQSKMLDSELYDLPEGVTRLTPQTFLQRPTRPGVRPAGLGRQAPPSGQADPARSGDQSTAEGSAKAEELGEEDQEHLQLNMEEAFFLCWAIGCLRVLNKETEKYLTPLELLQIALSAHNPYDPFTNFILSSPLDHRPDNPFLVSYAAYHHYRSLGWVVKTGIKFCCDWLLYKRGMVFSHAEFALLVLPQFMDPEDEENCPFNLPNKKPMSWQWLNTVNRVNTQVKKTLILVYVTIPPTSSVTRADYDDPERLLKKYSVREVTIRRFVPARMRD